MYKTFSFFLKSVSCLRKLCLLRKIASGLPNKNGDQHGIAIAHTALAIVRALGDFKIIHIPGKQLQVRIGLNSGNFSVCSSSPLHLPSFYMKNLSQLMKFSSYFGLHYIYHCFTWKITANCWIFWVILVSTTSIIVLHEKSQPIAEVFELFWSPLHLPSFYMKNHSKLLKFLSYFGLHYICHRFTWKITANCWSFWVILVSTTSIIVLYEKSQPIEKVFESFWFWSTIIFHDIVQVHVWREL